MQVDHFIPITAAEYGKVDLDTVIISNVNNNDIVVIDFTSINLLIFSFIISTSSIKL